MLRILYINLLKIISFDISKSKFSPNPYPFRKKFKFVISVFRLSFDQFANIKTLRFYRNSTSPIVFVVGG